MNFREITIKRAYSSDTDDILHDFYIPVLAAATDYRRIAGFFSSTSLAIAAKGIVGLIANGGTMQLIVSPRLTQQDLEILIKSKAEPKDFLEKTMLEEINKLEDQMVSDHVRALGWMVANNRLQIRVAIRNYDDVKVRNQDEQHMGLFHQKVGILKDAENNTITFSGSINETASGWLDNIEEFKVFRSWESPEYDYINADVTKFDKFWDNVSLKVKVFTVPEAVRNRLVELAPEDISQTDLWKWYQRKSIRPVRKIELYQHQERAVESWVGHGMRGIFEMATGTGKTFAAIACMHRALNRYDKLVIIIACPLQHLVKQWEREIANYGLRVQCIVADSSNPRWKSSLTDFLLDISIGHQSTLIILTTHRTLSSAVFLDIINKASPEINIMLLADEVHGIGAEKSQRGLLERFDLRLGLSATPKRWFDSTGTQAIYEYFGDIVFEFGLREAVSTINPATGMTYLSPYRYIPIFVSPTADEMFEYYEATNSIVKMYHNQHKDEKRNDILENLIFRRANVIKNIKAKFTALETLLKSLGLDVRWTIIYCTPQQIDDVMNLIDRMGIIYKHRFTMQEGTSAESRYGGLSERDYILKKFADGEYHILVAMKCLDEGVDVPPARKAILVASSGNPREYIQRIGRVIRRYPGKEEAAIYDFIVQPDFTNLPKELIEIEKKILKKELNRSMEIAQIAINNTEAMKILHTASAQIMEER
jgi:superfamily II DNA or RNA helicase